MFFILKMRIFCPVPAVGILFILVLENAECLPRVSFSERDGVVRGLMMVFFVGRTHRGHLQHQSRGSPFRVKV